MKFLITGGAGFIGSNIVEELLKRNHSVRVLDNFSTERTENIAEFDGRIEIIEGDNQRLSHCSRCGWWDGSRVTSGRTLEFPPCVRQILLY
jgi:nucleoside-diphosphate-sugar epimerase